MTKRNDNPESPEKGVQIGVGALERSTHKYQIQDSVERFNWKDLKLIVSLVETSHRHCELEI